MSKGLTELMAKYRNTGLVKGRLVLLPPPQALQFLTELEEHEVAVLGVELWYYVEHQGQNVLVEDPSGPGFEKELASDDPVGQSVAAARRYIEKELPESIVYVSFVENSGEEYWKAWEPTKSYAS